MSARQQLLPSQQPAPVQSAHRRAAVLPILPGGSYSFSLPSLRCSLSLSQSSYFCPLGMVAPSRDEAVSSNSSLVMPLAPSRLAPLRSVLYRLAPSRLAPSRLAPSRSARFSLAP